MSERDELVEKAQAVIDAAPLYQMLGEVVAAFAREYAAEEVRKVQEDLATRIKNSAGINSAPFADLVREYEYASSAPSLPSSPSPEQASASPGEERARCERCDKPIATSEDWARCSDGCECAKCVAICWEQGDCDPHGWREEALHLRASLSEQREANEALRKDATAQANALWEAYAYVCPPHFAYDGVQPKVMAGNIGRAVEELRSELETARSKLADADVLARAAEIGHRLDLRVNGLAVSWCLSDAAEKLRAAVPAARLDVSAISTVDRSMRFTVPSCEPSNEPPAAPASPAEGDIFEAVAREWYGPQGNKVVDLAAKQPPLSEQLAALLRERFGPYLALYDRLCDYGPSPVNVKYEIGRTDEALAVANGRGTIDAE